MLEYGTNNAVFRTTLGWVGLSVSDKGICRLVLPMTDRRSVERELKSKESGTCGPESGSRVRTRVLADAEKLLKLYFSGKSVSFDLPLDLHSYTPFQQAVWRAAAEIPAGETRSYAWIAKRIRNPKAVRAVGQALGANPIPIIIPCHRVISSSGAMGGYAGGTMLKVELLELEYHDKKRQ